MTMLAGLLAGGQNIIGLFLIADQDVLIWVSLVMALISIAVVALLARHRKWPELVSLFVIIFVVAMTVAHLFFKYVVDYPFLKAEPVSMSTDD